MQTKGEGQHLRQTHEKKTSTLGKGKGYGSTEKCCLNGPHVSLIVREMQIKTRPGHHIYTIRLVKTQSWRTFCWQGGVLGTLVCCWWESQGLWPHMGVGSFLMFVIVTTAHVPSRNLSPQRYALEWSDIRQDCMVQFISKNRILETNSSPSIKGWFHKGKSGNFSLYISLCSFYIKNENKLPVKKHLQQKKFFCNMIKVIYLKLNNQHLIKG